jgi:hypothetical protein
MRLESPAFGQNEPIPIEFTGDGANRLPPLRLVGVPEEAVSLALVVEDPEASGRSFTHWTIWNVAPQTTDLSDDRRPAGIEGLNDFGTCGWGGPCSPVGTRLCFFKAFALDVMLAVPEGADASELNAAMQGHVIDKAGLLGTFTHQ